ncbi:MAG: nitroreductase [Deltaproteobacteria bacterium]|nr:MAG: nitroreductase [Deltaproteobacteria bacterium]
MNNLMEMIKGRRSIRSYIEKDVPEELLSQVLEAFRWAPSWANTQCWEVIVIKDGSMKRKLQGCMPAKGNPAVNAVVQAPVVLVVCARLGVSGYYKDAPVTKFGDWFMYDLGIASQNLCLAAHSLGLGTVIVGVFDHDRAGDVLNVPEGYEPVTFIPVGYPEKTGPAPRRREISEFTHYETF